MPTLSAILQAAQIVAIERLVRIVRDSPSEREARLAAQALLKMNSRTIADAEAEPAANPTPDPALTTDELARLRRLLPHMRSERFTRRTPAYWRTMLAQHAPAATPLRQAG